MALKTLICFLFVFNILLLKSIIFFGLKQSKIIETDLEFDDADVLAGSICILIGYMLSRQLHVELTPFLEQNRYFGVPLSVSTKAALKQIKIKVHSNNAIQICLTLLLYVLCIEVVGYPNSDFSLTKLLQNCWERTHLLTLLVLISICSSLFYILKKLKHRPILAAAANMKKIRKFFIISNQATILLSVNINDGRIYGERIDYQDLVSWNRLNIFVQVLPQLNAGLQASGGDGWWL